MKLFAGYDGGGTKTACVLTDEAGTGAITYICTAEGHLRVGGWGPLLGGEGSGYDLDLRA